MRVLTLIILLCPFFSNAQFTKGQMFLGGSLSATGNEGATKGNLGSTSRTLGVTPKVGYFINKNWAVGTLLGYNFLRQTNHSFDGNYYYDEVNHSYTLGAGIFARRYFAISEKFMFTLQGDLRFARQKVDEIYTTTTMAGVSVNSGRINAQLNTISANIGPAFIFFPTPRWGLEMGIGSLGFAHRQDLSGHESLNSFSFLLNTTLTLGLTYYFK